MSYTYTWTCPLHHFSIASSCFRNCIGVVQSIVLLSTLPIWIIVSPSIFLWKLRLFSLWYIAYLTWEELRGRQTYCLQIASGGVSQSTLKGRTMSLTYIRFAFDAQRGFIYPIELWFIKNSIHWLNNLYPPGNYGITFHCKDIMRHIMIFSMYQLPSTHAWICDCITG